MFLQVYQNMIVNMRIVRSTVTQLGLFKIRKGSGVTPEMMKRLAVNGALPVENMQDVEQFVMQEASSASYKDEEVSQTWAERATGAFETVTGEQLPTTTTAIVAIYYYNGGYILDEITYQKGLSNRQIADVFKNQENRVMVVADSAEPKSIDEIMSYGINILGAKKGQGSVQQGIQYVQDQQISVTKRSPNIIKAYRNYLWKTDKDGEFISPNVPDHYLSDTMDAIRYGMDDLRPYNEENIDFNIYNTNYN